MGELQLAGAAMGSVGFPSGQTARPSKRPQPNPRKSSVNEGSRPFAVSRFGDLTKWQVRNIKKRGIISTLARPRCCLLCDRPVEINVQGGRSLVV
jgi:hypothetical protein